MWAAEVYETGDRQVSSIEKKQVFIDPPSIAYGEDRLFDAANPVLNRDGTLAPYIRLRAFLEQQGMVVHTADRLVQRTSRSTMSDYYSLGVLANYERLQACDDIRLRAFMIFEPPVVDPRLYQALPELTAAFDRVYVHNVDGDGYSLEGVDRSKLRKLYWPQAHKGVLEPFWCREDRLCRIVMINGNHKPASYSGELYSKRIEALAALAKINVVDLYGRGWERWWSRSSMWLPYWRHRKTLMSIYKGACKSKYEVLSKYAFALCFENMVMKGYVTEKIFDCLYAGTIPLYLGATDIVDMIPEEVFIDCRRYTSWENMWREVSNMSLEQMNNMREAGRAYLNSDAFLKYYDGFLPVTNAQE